MGKQFTIRNSLLTDNFANSQTFSIYNVIIISFTCLFFQTLGKEYVTRGRVTFGLDVIRTGFVHFDKAVFVWLCSFGSACASFLFFKIWSNLREFVKETATILDWFGLTCLVVYYFYTCKLLTDAVFYFDFNMPCIVFITLEHVRLLMKVHAFVRTRTSEGPFGLSFSKYLYFLFAPTLIYRDAYPRTNTINWKFVIQCLLECIASFFTLTFWAVNCFPPPERWAQKYTVSEILFEIAGGMIFTAMGVMTMFFLTFHSVQNLFAEILQFGDRLFYLDWWNDCDFNSWLTKWNKIVQDWLYYYVYCDFKEHICDDGFLAKLTVFLVSFAVHEWIMYCCVGGFLPLMFFVFMTVVFPSSFYEFPKTVLFYVLCWFLAVLLFTAGFAFYALEWYARSQSPLTDPTLLDLVVPRFITCDCVLKW
ncbi:sterol O-acyltransferase 1-like isoform X1 [Zophobas morio]|uniref:sterol O-acyltransferase 1-like isoform X1 n=1 Tax=Zophobas morio TaxID=2755281 RepID=UPI003083BC03